MNNNLIITVMGCQ